MRERDRFEAEAVGQLGDRPARGHQHEVALDGVARLAQPRELEHGDPARARSRCRSPPAPAAPRRSARTARAAWPRRPAGRDTAPRRSGSRSSAVEQVRAPGSVALARHRCVASNTSSACSIAVAEPSTPSTKSAPASIAASDQNPALQPRSSTRRPPQRPARDVEQRLEEVAAALLGAADPPRARDGRADALRQLEAVVPARKGVDPLLEFLGVQRRLAPCRRVAESGARRRSAWPARMVVQRPRAGSL